MQNDQHYSSTANFIMNRVFPSVVRDNFLAFEALTLEKYQRSVHIFNLQIGSYAINTIAQIFPRYVT